MHRSSEKPRKHLMAYRIRPAIYNLFNAADFSNMSAPINSNLLKFIDKETENEYCKRLFIDPVVEKPSENYKNDLIYFYTYISLISVIYITFSALYYFNNLITANHLIFHISYLACALVISYILLVGLFRVPKILKNSKFYIFILGLIYYTYFIIGKESLLSSMFSDKQGVVDLPVSLGIISLTIFLKIMIFDSFIYSLYITFYVLLLYFLVNFSNRDQNKLEAYSEYFIIVVTFIFQVIESQALDMRSRLVFWNYLKNERDDSNSCLTNTKGDEIMRSENESLVKACESVQKNLKEACSVIIYKDIKELLKSSIIVVDQIKKKIGNSMFTKSMKIEESLIDNEDKEFIYQNCVKFTINPDKSSNPRSIQIQNNFSPISLGSSESIESLLSQFSSSWSFDVFFIKELTGKSISIIARFLFKKWDLFSYLKQSLEKIEGFFLELENHYKDNPYHNACHAADVLHSFMYFMMHSFIKSHFSHLDLVSSIIAALGHDVGHPALTSRFLISSHDKIAIKYNDSSVLENMHASKTFKILHQPENNILENMTRDDWLKSRKMIIRMIIETDMSKHFKIIGKFRMRATTLSNLDIENFEDKLQVLGIGIKCADVGHCAKERDLHKRWSKLVCDEFFNQGDFEKARGMPVSMYCDRDGTDISKSQSGFLKNICLPLFEVFSLYLLSDVFNEVVLAQLKNNLEYWTSIKKRRETEKVDKNKFPIIKKINTHKD